MALPSQIESTDTEPSTDSSGEAKLRGTVSENEPLSPHATVAGLDSRDVFNAVSSNRSKVRRAYEIVQKSPEAIGIIKAIIDDTLGAGSPRFEYVGPETTPGTQAIDDANEFWENQFHLVAEEAMADELVAGDAYIFQDLITEDAIKSVVDSQIEEYDFNYAEFKAVGRSILEEKARDIIDEDNLTLQGARIVPASTMYEDIDQHGDVERFVQRVGGKQVEFDPDEIVHVGNMPMDGDVYSFTPMFSMLEELIMLAQVKDYHSKLFQNAGMANKLYKLPDETPNSQNFKQFISTVRDFRKNENTNKDMITTGDVEVEELNDIDGTMEFESLSKYITTTLLQGWNIPPSRLGIDVSGTQSESRSSQMAMEGYYKRIQRRQQKWETILNNEIFIPYFNCKIHLPEPNVKQAIREADRDMKKLNAALRMAAAGIMDREGVRKYMNIEKTKMPGADDDMTPEEFRQMAFQLQSGSVDGNLTLSDAEVDGGTADDQINDDRSATQQENEEQGETSPDADNAQ